MDSTKDEFLQDLDESGYFEFGPGPPEFLQATSRYRLKHELGRGGMGVVYIARDLDLNRDVAVKILLGQYIDSDPASTHFINEAKIMGMLEHPGIAHIYDNGFTEHGRPFHVMKLVEGKTLTALLEERGSIAQLNAQILNVFSCVCQAMSYTHAQHVIHLDLKPANIMVGAFGEVHVMDWGLARSVDSAESPIVRTSWEGQCDQATTSSKNGVHGTLQYMAPEQARGERVNKRTDVFCLGAILCEILTGLPPYNGDDRKQVLALAKSADLDPAMERLDQCVSEKRLVRLAKLCLQANPDDRPWDANVLAKEMAMYSESALERLRNDMTQFFELSLDMFCIAGFDGYFRRINRNFSRVLGYTETELLARPFLDFVHPDDQEKTVEVMSQLYIGRPVIRFCNRYVTRSNQPIEFEWTAKSVVSENVIFAVARNIG